MQALLRQSTIDTLAVACQLRSALLRQVWDVLTDYEALPDFIPNLAVSERVPLPPGSPDSLVRLRQVLRLLHDD